MLTLSFFFWSFVFDVSSFGLFFTSSCWCLEIKFACSGCCFMFCLVCLISFLGALFCCCFFIFWGGEGLSVR